MMDTKKIYEEMVKRLDFLQAEKNKLRYLNSTPARNLKRKALDEEFDGLALAADYTLKAVRQIEHGEYQRLYEKKILQFIKEGLSEEEARNKADAEMEQLYISYGNKYGPHW